jgi:hypothetical protein
MAKSIFFKMVISGSGIVNFDSNDQKWLWNKQNGVERVNHNNVSFGKGRYYKTTSSDGKEYLEKVAVISADCIRHAIFEDNMFIHLPNVMHDDELLLKVVASPAFLERGYLFAREGKTIWKRKSPLAFGYAKAITSSVSSLETYSNSQPKSGIEKSEDVSETSFFKREVRGDTTYECSGFIDIGELGFISLSEVHDRLSFDYDYADKFIKNLSEKIGTDIPKPAFYQKVGDLYEIPELGIKLTDDLVKALTVDIIKRLARFNIMRTTNGNAQTTNLKIKIVNDPLEDLMSDDDGWIDVFDGKKFNHNCVDKLTVSETYKKVTLEEEAKQKIASYRKKFGYEKAPKSAKGKKKEESSDDDS